MREGESAPAPSDAPTVRPRRSWVLDVLEVMKREPILFVTLAYVGVSFIGLWASYWFFRYFNLPVLEYLQVSDFLVAGLRDPAYLAWLLGYALLMWAISWPVFFWRRHPQRVDEYRRRWWGRAMFLKTMDPARPPGRFSWAPETALAFGLFWGGIWILMGYVFAKAENVVDGGGDRVAVTLSGESRPLAGEARLLGTSSNYVFLYWPASGRAEAVSAQAVGRLESLPRRTPAASAPASK